MKKLKYLTFLVFFLLLPAIKAFSQQKEKTNVVFILADDLGWSDLSFTESEFYETPNIDKLAKSGTFFSNAYAMSPVCAPSRGAIMSGKFPARNGYTGLSGQWGKPSRGELIDADFTSHLPLKEVTLAEALKDAGYFTAHFAKWHLGKEDEYSPLKQGFDRYITTSSFGPWKGRFNENGEFMTDVLTDQALTLMEERKNEPFFLNLWYEAVHTPIKAKEKDIVYFIGKAKKMGLNTVDPFITEGEYPADLWFRSQRGKPIKKRVIQSDPVYAAFLFALDYNVGRLMDKLEELGLADNTMVIFFSDNGGLSSVEGSPTSNAPLREGKGWSFDGGIKVPLIIKAPGQAKAGRVVRERVGGIDLYPTVLDVLGLPLMPAQHVDGVSLLPAIKGKNFKRGKPIYWHSPHYFNNGGYPFSGIIHEDWKYLYRYDLDEELLFNLKRDPGEKENLVATKPEKVSQLKAMLNAWKREVDAKEPSLNRE